MSLATFSNERLIDEKLKQLDCGVVHFAAISKIVGTTRLNQGLQGKRNFEQADAEQLLTVLDEMAELKRTSAVTPDWTDSERIHLLLQARRDAKRETFRVLEDLGIEDLNLEER